MYLQQVVIGANFTVRPYSKFSLIAQPTEEDSSDEELEYVEAASVASESPQKLNQGVLLYKGIILSSLYKAIIL